MLIRICFAIFVNRVRAAWWTEKPRFVVRYARLFRFRPSSWRYCPTPALTTRRRRRLSRDRRRSSTPARRGYALPCPFSTPPQTVSCATLTTSKDCCSPRCRSDPPNSTRRTTLGVWMDGELASFDAETSQLRHPRLDADANAHRYRHVAMLAELRQQLDRTYLLFTVTIRMTFDAFRLFDQLRP